MIDIESLPAHDAVKRHGAALIRGLLDPTEAEVLRAEADRLWTGQERLEPQNLRLALRRDTDGAWVLDRLDPVADLSQRFAALNADPRLIRPVSRILGPAPRVAKDKLIYKRPGTQGFGPHRDFPYFRACGAAAEEMLTVCIALDPAGPDNGAIRLYPSLRHAALASPADEPRDIAAGQLPSRLAVQPELQPGDALLFDGTVPHCSDPNRADFPRRAYMVTYVPATIEHPRERYYAARFREQSAERSRHHDGPFWFEWADGIRWSSDPGA